MIYQPPTSGLMLASRYASPALGICTKLSRQKKSNLQEKISNGGSFKIKEFESFFPKAYDMIQSIATDKTTNEWSMQVVIEYWRNFHNSIAEQEPCKVKIIEYQNQKLIIPAYLGELQKGTTITTHLNTAIEIL